MSGQSRRHSWLEAWANIAIGYGINFTANLIFMPMFGFDVTVSQNLQIGAIFTVISLVRSYVLRRWFNAVMLRAIDRISR